MGEIPVGSPPPLYSRACRAVLLIPAITWLGVFFFLPLLVILAISLAEPASPYVLAFAPGNYLRLFHPELHLGRILARSFAMALATTVFCLALGYPLAYFVVRRTPGLRRLLYFLVVIPLWTNSLVLTYAWMVILRQDGATDGVARWLGLLDEAGSLNLLYTPFAVLIGLVYWHLPFMVYPIYAALERFDWSLLDAAQDLGATRWRAIGHILLPMSSPGILAGCLLVFIPALGNFVVPQLLGGAKSMFVGNLIQQRFLSQPQDWPLGAALGLLMMGVVTAALWAYFRFARRDVSVG